MKNLKFWTTWEIYKKLNFGWRENVEFDILQCFKALKKDFWGLMLIVALKLPTSKHILMNYSV